MICELNYNVFFLQILSEMNLRKYYRLISSMIEIYVFKF